MTKKRGVITIEAAIVMPIFIITIVGFMYFMKVIYIQDQIESAMTRTAHELANYGYIVDKIQLAEFQQDVYEDGQKDMEQLAKSFNSIRDQGKGLIADAKSTSDMSIETIDMGTDLKLFGGKVTLVEFIQQVNTARKEIPAAIEQMESQLDSMLTTIEIFIQDAAASSGRVASGELVEFVNGKAADAVISNRFYKHIDKEQLEAWHISAENKSIDFSDSSYMLYDDCVVVVARYKVQIPMFSGITDGMSFYQSVSARAYTGSYDYDIAKKVFEEDKNAEDLASDTIYYISNKEKAYCYHRYSCLRQPLQEGFYEDRVANYNQKVCDYCQDHYMGDELFEATRLVYFVSDSTVLHLSKNCVKVTSEDISAVTKAQAEAKGKRPCSKCLKELLNESDKKKDD